MRNILLVEGVLVNDTYQGSMYFLFFVIRTSAFLYLTIQNV